MTPGSVSPARDLNALDQVLAACRVGWNPWPRSASGGAAIGEVLLPRSWRHPTRGYGTESFWGIVGSSCVVTAWSGMAMTSGSATSGSAMGDSLWISNGGHADYGGNEWYRFDLATGRWRMETYPSRLVPSLKIPRKDGSSFLLPVPDDGRSLRGHVYGSPLELADGRILTVNPVPFARNTMYFDDHVQNVWIFDPRTLDEKPAPVDFMGMGGAVRLSNGNVLFGTESEIRIFDASLTRRISRSGGGLGFNCGYDPGARMAAGGRWSSSVSVATLDAAESRVMSQRTFRAPIRLTYAGVLPCGDGVFAFFGGDGDAWLLDTARGRWQQHTYPHPPNTKRLSNRIQWLPGRKAAICIPHDVDEPVHIFKPDFEVRV